MVWTMDGSTGIIGYFVRPFLYPYLPHQRIYWLYLASALVLAVAVYAVGRARGRGGLRGLIAYCFPKAIFTHPSARVDYRYFFVHKISYAILFAPMLVGSSAVSSWTNGVLEAVAGSGGSAWSFGTAAAVAFTVLVALGLDLGRFISHYLQHKVPILWEFHKVHHSAEVLTPITVYRMHPVDDLLAGTMTGVFVGVVHGTHTYLYADGVGAITVMSLNIVIFAFYVFGYNLRHSHVWLAYPRRLSHLLMSPAQHQIHHSRETRHLDRNIGFMFSFWDWMAGTLYVPEGREDFRLGLYGGEHKEYDGVLRLFFLPLKKAAALVAGSLDRWRRA